jgi:hypothetical protein
VCVGSLGGACGDVGDDRSHFWLGLGTDLTWGKGGSDCCSDARRVRTSKLAKRKSGARLKRNVPLLSFSSRAPTILFSVRFYLVMCGLKAAISHVPDDITQEPAKIATLQYLIAIAIAIYQANNLPISSHLPRATPSTLENRMSEMLASFPLNLVSSTWVHVVTDIAPVPHCMVSRASFHGWSFLSPTLPPSPPPLTDS